MKFYDDRADRAAAVAAMFDRIAARYDLMNRLMTLGIDRSWRRRAIAALQLAPGALVLDLACGTGDLAAAAAAAGAKVIGVDFSAGMLKKAGARRLGCPLIRADALDLPLLGASCDAVVSGFALRNFADLAAAFAQCARVLKPGGAIVLLELDRPSHPMLRLGHSWYVHGIVPLLGRLFAERAAYAYLPDSLARLPAPSRMLEMLRAAGFEALGKQRLLGGAAQLITGRRAR